MKVIWLKVIRKKKSKKHFRPTLIAVYNVTERIQIDVGIHYIVHKLTKVEQEKNNASGKNSNDHDNGDRNRDARCDQIGPNLTRLCHTSPTYLHIFNLTRLCHTSPTCRDITFFLSLRQYFWTLTLIVIVFGWYNLDFFLIDRTGTPMSQWLSSQYQLYWCLMQK